MLTLPIRFITSRGPDSALTPTDVAFLGSEEEFAKACQRKAHLANALAAELSGHALFIYRMSRSTKGLYLWRQSPRSKGDEKGREPAGSQHIGYAIYAAPKHLADDDSPSDGVSTLTQKVLSICDNYGQERPPGNGGP